MTGVALWHEPTSPIAEAIQRYLAALDREGWPRTKDEKHRRSALVSDPGWTRSGRAWA